MSEPTDPTGATPPGTSRTGPDAAVLDPSPGSGPRVSGEQMRDVNRLRRSRSDRYVAGVAGGLGRHFDIDPTVVRVLLAVLTFFGGAGILVYAAVWLFVPEEGTDRALVEVGSDALRVVLVVVAAVALTVVFGSPFFGGGWGWSFPFPLVVVGLVVLVLLATRRNRRPGQPAVGPPPPAPWGSTPRSTPATTSWEGTSMSATDTLSTASPLTPPYAAGQQPPAWMPPPTSAYVPPPRPRRTGLVLFWPTLAVIAIALGVLGIVDVSSGVPISAYAALALGISALALVLGAFVGRPGGLIALGLAGILALGVTSAVDAATGGDVSPARDVTAAPTSAATLRPAYTLKNGSLLLDLSGIGDVEALDGREVDVRINAGELRVVLPRSVTAQVTADIRYAGSIEVDGETREGLDPGLSRTVAGSSSTSPTLTLDIDARVGEITVEQD